MTTRQPVLPRVAPRGQSDPKEYYLCPMQVPNMRNTAQRSAPRIQTMPPSSEDPVGIYSYLDQEDMDDNFLTKTLEAIEDGEFSQIPEEIMSWYNSITQEPGDAWDDDTKLRGESNRHDSNFETRANGHEYIDLTANRFSAPAPGAYEEVSEASKRNKRFLKGDKMNFIKDRLNQFLNNNFKGIKKREEPKKFQNASISEPVEKFCAGILVTSNSFDNSNSSLEYIENPKRRSSTQTFIAQQLPPAAPRDDSWYTYLDSQESKLQGDTARPYSKSLENVFIPLQPPTPSPLEKLMHEQEDPYLSPISIVLPTPPPRVSSHQRDHLRYNSDLTQDYIEPRVISTPPLPRSSIPLPKSSVPLLDSPHVRLPHPRNRSTGSKPTDYILPEDTPVTPMTRFVKDQSISSIPVLSPGSDYSDPMDFNLSELRRAQTILHAKPVIRPKPCLPKVSTNEECSQKPTPPPKPVRQPPRKPHSSSLQTERPPGALPSGKHTRPNQAIARAV